MQHLFRLRRTGSWSFQETRVPKPELGNQRLAGTEKVTLIPNIEAGCSQVKDSARNTVEPR
jgi:hypothetical protein